jgi:hypothetical protein
MRGPLWYAVATKWRQSHAAMLAIEALGFRAFLPWVSCPLPKGARELRPMFGTYCFAHFDAARDGWGEIARLRCVPDRPVLCLAGRHDPAPIPDAIIDRIHAAIGRRLEDVEAAGGKPVVRDPVGTLVSIGAEVRLVGNDRAGDGKVEMVKRGGREARVAFEGFTLPVWVPADRLELLA